MKKKTSSWMITLLVVFVGLVLIVTGLMRSNFDYYVTIEHLKTAKPSVSGATVRVLGQVAAESWKPAGSVGSYTFTLEDGQQVLEVEYTGAPISAASGRQIVVEGSLDSRGVLVSRKIMTKCASKYSAGPQGER